MKVESENETGYLCFYYENIMLYGNKENLYWLRNRISFFSQYAVALLLPAMLCAQQEPHNQEFID